MKNLSLGRLAALGVLLGAATGAIAGAAAAPACDDPRPLRMALVPKSSSHQQHQAIKPLKQALEVALDRRVELVPAASYGSVIEGLLSDGIDLAELGPASYALLMERQPAVTAFAALAGRGQPATAGPASYRSALVVRRDGGVGSLQGLRHKTVSLTDPASTSGALLPRQAVRRLTGLALETHFGRVTFAGSHDRAIDAVRKGLVDAAFVSTSRLDEAVRQARIGPDELVVIWQSVPIPADPFVHRSRLCKPLVDKIRQAFFSTAEPMRAMFEALAAERFVPVSDADYQGIRAQLAERP